jgi:hypothetical protein
VRKLHRLEHDQRAERGQFDRHDYRNIGHGIVFRDGVFSSAELPKLLKFEHWERSLYDHHAWASGRHGRQLECVRKCDIAMKRAWRMI